MNSDTPDDALKTAREKRAAFVDKYVSGPGCEKARAREFANTNVEDLEAYRRVKNAKPPSR